MDPTKTPKLSNVRSAYTTAPPTPFSAFHIIHDTTVQQPWQNENQWRSKRNTGVPGTHETKVRLGQAGPQVPEAVVWDV